MDKFDNPEYMLGWLAGIIDGEGSVNYYEKKKHRAVKIANTNINILQQVERCLKIFGIPYKVNLMSRGITKTGELCTQGYLILIQTRAGIERIASLIDLAHELKQARLKALPLSYIAIPPSAHLEDIRRLVQNQKLLFSEVAKIIGVNVGHVRYVAHRHGISLSKEAIQRSPWRTRDRIKHGETMRKRWADPVKKAEIGRKISDGGAKRWAARKRLIGLICDPKHERNPRAN